MSLRQRQDSSRDLLEELEDGWGAPPPPAAGMPLPGPAKNNGTTKAATESHATESDATESHATGAATDDVPSHLQSNPDLASLDEGWLDELFPGEDSDDDDDDDDDEPEPELPDERLDPEAFALAKKAREERAARKKEKRRLKAEAKRARQKARAEAMRQKQKAKKSRAVSPAHRPAEPKSKKKKNERRKESGPTPRDPETTTAEVERDDDGAEPVAAGVPVSKSRAKSSDVARRPPSTLASVKLLAIVLAALLALAAAVAAILK